MEATTKIGYLFFTRHGERADDKKVNETKRIKYKGDPPLSIRGYDIMKDKGKTINEYIETKIGYTGPITVVSSPFIRTLQTAAAVTQSLSNIFKVYDHNQVERESAIYYNPMIGLGLTSGNFSKDPAKKVSLIIIW